MLQYRQFLMNRRAAEPAERAVTKLELLICKSGWTEEELLHSMCELTADHLSEFMLLLFSRCVLVLRDGVPGTRQLSPLKKGRQLKIWTKKLNKWKSINMVKKLLWGFQAYWVLFELTLCIYEVFSLLCSISCFFYAHFWKTPSFLMKA